MLVVLAQKEARVCEIREKNPENPTTRKNDLVKTLHCKGRLLAPKNRFKLLTEFRLFRFLVFAKCLKCSVLITNKGKKRRTIKP